MSDQDGLSIALISLHGLIRGHDLELGRDADTGGQTKYVVELTRALAQAAQVHSVTLFTRMIKSPDIDDDYAREVEDLDPKARIVRISCGPDEEYLPKEVIWDHLDSFVDNFLNFLREHQIVPDIIHSHYADAGYVGSRLAHFLGVPLVHTGHSLGRVKRLRLLATGLGDAHIEQRYNMSRRIDAEEMTLASADRVITSTYQEIEEQYELYDHYQPDQMRVIAPGTNLALFHPPTGDEWHTPIGRAIRGFLHAPDKPLILALSRPDPRKNIAALLKAFGESPRLQELANLAIIAGNRDDICDMDDGAQEVLTDFLLAVDRYDLYGKVAYPKHHLSDDVPVIYRMIAVSRGVFVNAALTEPFGLTLLEAAASGVPIVATEDGGPRDIVGNCSNGLLIDPLDSQAIADALIRLLDDSATWQDMASNGLQGVRAHYSWDAHTKSYIAMIQRLVDKTEIIERMPLARRAMRYQDRAIFSDLDQNLLGDPQALAEFLKVLRVQRKSTAFGIATGRRLDSALSVLRKFSIPDPDILITSGGTAIHYAPDLTADDFWPLHIDHGWTPHVVRRVLAELPGLTVQPNIEQSRFKVSYYYDANHAPGLDEIISLLHQRELNVTAIVSFGQFLDILPIRASKGQALRYVAEQWGIALANILVAGGSGADEDMIRGNALGVIVANRHHEELSHLTDSEGIFYAQRAHAAGILEAIDHFDFFPA